MKRIPVVFVVFLIFGLFLFNCTTTGPGGKKSLILISTEQEIAIGESLVEDIEYKNKVTEDSILADYVNQLGQEITTVSDRKDIKYHFKVLESEEINAFACPGGFIYIYSGLLMVMDNEAQLAGVLAHEIGHVVARHSVKRLQQVLGLQVLLSLTLGESSELTQKAVATGIGVILQGYSRQNEFEADYNGAYYMTKTGHNPEGMIQLFGQFEEMEKRRKNTFLDQLLASHPPAPDRIAKAKEHIKSFDLGGKELILGEEDYKKIKARLK